MAESVSDPYPLLTSFIQLKGLPLKPSYTTRDVSEMFGVHPRTIQYWIKNGRIPVHDLPGRAKILPIDIEALLARTKSADK